MKSKLLLMGGGGHCKVILDLLAQINAYEVVGIIDVSGRVGEKIGSIAIVGTDKDLPEFFKNGTRQCFISMGSVGECRGRRQLHTLARQAGFVFPNLVHPSAQVSLRAGLGEGNYVGPGAVINADVRIGHHCIINTGAVIEHDCLVGDFAHVSPGAILNGGVVIGAHSHIGAGSVVIQNLRIGSDAVVGAGSVVTKHVGDGVTVYGNPCKEHKHA